MASENIQVRFNEVMSEYGPVDTLAQRVKAARKHAGLTQEQAVKLSGVTQSDISKIERGKTLRPVGLIHLARAFNCDPYWLDTGNGFAPWEIGGATPAGARAHGQPTAPSRPIQEAPRSRTVNESQWALLEDFDMLPDDEKAALRATLKAKADQVRKIVADYLGKRGISATPAPDSRVEQTYGAPPPPPPEKTGASSWERITPIPSPDAPGKKGAK
jgi:transcriptional regulator with XRE-family HTH domain